MPEARGLSQTDLVLECRLLGSPKLLLDGTELDVRYRKVIGLFAFLALEGMTPRAKLSGLLWSQVTDEAARRNLRRELHRLKNDLPALNNHLEISENTLQLRAPFQSDVALFEQAISAGHVEQALRFYAGTLLQGLELEGASDFHDWCDQKRERLERSKRRAMLEFAELLETRGDWHKALEIHHGLLESDPFQERTHRDLMRLYSLMGKREAALLQFEKCQTMLETELGLEPLPETALLAESIRMLSFEPSVTTKKTTPRSNLNMPARVPFIGRSKVWAELEEACNTGQLVFLAGEPGVGKTRLMLEFAASRGLRIGLFEARPGDALVAFSTVSRMLRRRFSAQSPDTLEPWVRSELSRLMPEWGLEPPPLAPNEGRLRLFQAVSEVLLSNPENTAAIADDIQFFDAQSLELLAFVATKAFERGVRRVSLAAYRLGELSTEAEQLVANHVRAGMAVQINLESLNEADVLELVQKLSGSSDASLFSRRLFKSTGGNPFFALETIKGLFESGALTLDARGAWMNAFDQGSNAELPVPKNVRETVLARVKQLGEQPRRLLEAACLAGDGFQLEHLQSALALNEWESLEALEKTLDARLLESSGDGYRFAHDLIRQALEVDLRPERRKLLHQKLAVSFEKVGSAPALIADHFEKAGLLRQAAIWFFKAALGAEQLLIWQLARNLFEHALELGLKDSDAFEANLGLFRCWRASPNGEQPEAYFLAMERLAADNANTDWYAQMLIAKGRAKHSQGEFQVVVLEMDRLLEISDLTAIRQVEAQKVKGDAFMSLGKLEEANAEFFRALESIGELPSRLKGEIQQAIGLVFWHLGDYQSALKFTQTASSTHTLIGNRHGELHALNLTAGIAVNRGQTVEAIDLFKRLRFEAAETGFLFMQALALVNLGGMLLSLGRLAEAEPLLEEGLHLTRATQKRSLEASFLIAFNLLYFLQGQLGKAIRAAYQAIAITDELHELGIQIGHRLNLVSTLFDLSDFEGIQGLLETAQQLLAGQIHQHSAELEIRLAQLEGQHSPQTAIDRLKRLSASSIFIDAARNTEFKCVLAQMYLRLGNPNQALQVVSELPKTSSIENLTIQLEVQMALGEIDRALFSEVKSMIENDLDAPLVGLALRKVFARVLTLEHQPAKAKQVLTRARERLLELAATLEAYPELKIKLLEKNRDLTEL